MPRQAMLEPLIDKAFTSRLVIDVLDLARNAGSHHGKIALSEFERLQDYLAANSGELNTRFAGHLDGDGRPFCESLSRVNKPPMSALSGRTRA